MDDTLFDGYEPEETAPLSVDRRRTLRQAAQIAAGVHPVAGRLHPLASRHRDATSPKTDPFTCGSCWFREPVNRGTANSYPKCTAQDGARVTSGPGSDVRAWWPACPDYTPADTGLSPDAARTVYPDE